MAAATSVKYLHPLTKPSIPLPLIALSEFLLILSYSVRPSPYRKLLFIPIAGLCLGLLFLTQYSIEDAVLEIGVGIRLLTVCCFASANILLSDPQKELRLVSWRDGKKNDGDRARLNPDHADSNESKSEEKLGYEDLDISSAPFLARLWWGITLWGNPRGINYAHEPSAILPPRPVGLTTAQFVVQTLVWVTMAYVIQDLGKICLNVYDDMRRANDLVAFAAIGDGEGHGVPGVLAWLGIDFSLWRLWSLSFMVLMYAMMNMSYGFVSVFSVLFGITKPNDWPPLFGRPTEAYTLRKTWGRFWHQMFRRMFNLHATFLTSPFSNLKITAHIKLFLIFLVSGIMHYAGEAYMMQDLFRSRAVLWFVLQAVGITFEDAVVGAVRAMVGKGRVSDMHIMSRVGLRTLGYLWVIAWFGMTLPVWTDPLMKAGYAREAKIASGSFSPVRGLWKGEWWWGRMRI